MRISDREGVDTRRKTFNLYASFNRPWLTSFSLHSKNASVKEEVLFPARGGTGTETFAALCRRSGHRLWHYPSPSPAVRPDDPGPQRKCFYNACLDGTRGRRDQQLDRGYAGLLIVFQCGALDDCAGARDCKVRSFPHQVRSASGKKASRSPPVPVSSMSIAGLLSPAIRAAVLAFIFFGGRILPLTGTGTGKPSPSHR